jgi:hypothetical protein
MPSFTVATALALAFTHGGTPWDLDSWKEITSISSGLFPKEDGDLPAGISRADANDIATYFDALSKKGTQEQQIQFSRAKDRYVGRKLWNSWLAKNYRRWRIHDMAVKAMKDNNCHPHMIMKADELDTWPDATIIANLAQPALGLALFGNDGLTSLNMVKPNLRSLVHAILVRSLDTLRTNFSRICKKAEALREAAEQAYLGRCRKGCIGLSLNCI